MKTLIELTIKIELTMSSALAGAVKSCIGLACSFGALLCATCKLLVEHPVLCLSVLITSTIVQIWAQTS